MTRLEMYDDFQVMMTEWADEMRMVYWLSEREKLELFLVLLRMRYQDILSDALGRPIRVRRVVAEPKEEDWIEVEDDLALEERMLLKLKFG